MSKALAHILDLDELLGEIPKRLLEVFKASREAILVQEKQGLVPRAVEQLGFRAKMPLEECLRQAID